MTRKAPAHEQAGASSLDVVEVTSFRLEGCTCAEFAEANAEVDDWLSRQRGFRSLHIAEREHGEIVDVLVWDGVEAGRMALHASCASCRMQPPTR